MSVTYLDWAATSPVDPEAAEIVRSTSLDFTGNPSSLHKEGKKAAALLETSRKQCAALAGCSPGGLIFTSGGTESNALVLSSLLRRKIPGGTVIIPGIEHPSVYEFAVSLREFGITPVIIPASPEGIVLPETVEKALTGNTIMVCVMGVNNETGVVQPISGIAEVIRSFEKSGSGGRKIHFHCDAVQAVGKIPHRSIFKHADSVSVSSHKFTGPRGCGLLYLKNPLEPLLAGGGQEYGIRSGTENLPAIAATAFILGKRLSRYDEEKEHARYLKKILMLKLKNDPRIEFIPKNLDPDDKRYSPFITTFMIPPVPGEVIIRVMSDHNFAISTGSACSSKKKKKTRGLEAMGLSPEKALCAVRVSTGWSTSEKDILSFADALSSQLSVLLPNK